MEPIINNAHWIILAVIIAVVLFKLGRGRARRVGYSGHTLEKDHALGGHDDYIDEDLRELEEIEKLEPYGDGYATPNDAPNAKRSSTWSYNKRKKGWSPKSGKAAPWFAIVFITFWLMGWTAAIVTVSGMFFSGEYFIAVWLVPALAGEVFAIWMLIQMIKSRIGRRK